MTLVRVPAWQGSSPTPTTGYYITTMSGTSTCSNITTFSGGGSGGSGTVGTMLSGGSGGGSSGTMVSAPWPPQVIIEKSFLDKIKVGDELTVSLPDDARLIVERTGSYRIEDKNAKVTYKANRVREFNTFLNASDRLEDFIRYCKDFNLSQRELLELPIKLFIMWLILEAADADEIPPEIEDVEKLQLEFKRKSHPRCKCGRFIRRARAAQGFMFCNGDHYNKYSDAAQSAATERIQYA